MYCFDWPARQAEIQPDKMAMIEVTKRRGLTYGDLNQKIGRLAVHLRDGLGVKKGDRVALMSHNNMEHFEALFACARIGAIGVCLNWRLSVQELIGICGDCTPVLLLHDHAQAPKAEPLADALDIPRMVYGLYYDQTLLGISDPDSSDPASGSGVYNLEDTWYLLYTSGTTGKPKGVIQTFSMALFNAIHVTAKTGLSRDDVTLNVLPNFHTAGLNLYILPMIHAGGTVYQMSEFDPALTLDTLQRGVTMFFGVPAVYLLMSQHPDFEGADLSKVRSWVCGGAPVPESLLHLYRNKKDALICNGFGMTETGPTLFLNYPEHALNKPLSVGSAVLHSAAKIVDGSGKTLGNGNRGELLVKGPGITPGYWQDPERTEAAFTDGWLHTGDVAYRDEEGFFYIVDRIKDMYISGGENVYPAEVENVLCAMDGVVEAAVIGVPDEKWGEVGRAFIAPAEGHGLDAEKVIAHCREQLAHYKVPRSVSFMAELPRNASGKILKTELRKL